MFTLLPLAVLEARAFQLDVLDAEVLVGVQNGTASVPCGGACTGREGLRDFVGKSAGMGINLEDPYVLISSATLVVEMTGHYEGVSHTLATRLPSANVLATVTFALSVVVDTVLLMFGESSGRVALSANKAEVAEPVASAKPPSPK